MSWIHPVYYYGCSIPVKLGWIPLTKGQQHRKYFHGMGSPCALLGLFSIPAKLISGYSWLFDLHVEAETKWLQFSRQHLQMHFLEWKGISFKISIKFAPKGPINNIPALVQIMAWCRPGDKPLSEPVMVNLLMHIRTWPQWLQPPWVCHMGFPSQRASNMD